GVDDVLPERLSRQILVERVKRLALVLVNAVGMGDGQKPFADGRRDGCDTARIRKPDAVVPLHVANVRGQSRADEDCDIRARRSLVLLELCDPALAPVPSALRLPD